MPHKRIDMDRFIALPRDEQLTHIMMRGQILPEHPEANIFLYKLDEYFVRVTISSNPLQVMDIKASRDPHHWPE